MRSIDAGKTLVDRYCRPHLNTSLLAGLTTLLFVTCPGLVAGADLPAPDAERGSLGISIETRAPVRIFKAPVQQVFFVRVDQDQDPLKADSVIPSNYSARDQLYLLNASPGRYVAVATLSQGGDPRSGMAFLAFLSSEAILQTEVAIVPGRMVFMGKFSLQTSTKTDAADPAQNHYHDLILRNHFTTAPYTYTAQLTTVARDAQTAAAFWRQAIAKVFKDESAWLELVRREMGSPTE